MSHFVYMLRCSDGSLYTGYATNVEKRLREHNGDVQGRASRYTRSRRPVVLAHTELCATKSEALKREYQIKQLTKNEKEKLIIDATDQ